MTLLERYRRLRWHRHQLIAAGNSDLIDDIEDQLGEIWDGLSDFERLFCNRESSALNKTRFVRVKRKWLLIKTLV